MNGFSQRLFLWILSVGMISVGMIGSAAFASGQVLPESNPPGQSAAAKPSQLTSNASVAVQPSEAEPSIEVDAASLIPDLPPLPAARATLIGGTIEKLDRVQDQITVRVFGGGKEKALFDPRTRIFRDGAPGTPTDLKVGDRVYIDTILNGSTVFARSIRLRGAIAQGENQGVIVGYRSDKQELSVRDGISPQPVKLHVTSATTIVQGDRTVSAGNLMPGSLVAIQFGSEPGGRVVAQRVAILAMQGASFTFAGRVTFLDLRANLIVLKSDTDDKTYEIYLDPSANAIMDANLREGSDVTAVARFDGNRYVARTLTMNSASEK